MNFEYDALVLIHPDFDNAANPNYVSNLARIVNQCQLRGLPVFKMDMNCPIQDPTISDILAHAHSIPVVTWQELGRAVELKDELAHAQEEVDFIARVIGKKKSEIRLGMGGIYGDMCVGSYATTWSKAVETNHPILNRTDPCGDPIGSAVILDEIVII